MCERFCTRRKSLSPDRRSETGHCLPLLRLRVRCCQENDGSFAAAAATARNIPLPVVDPRRGQLDHNCCCLEASSFVWSGCLPLLLLPPALMSCLRRRLCCRIPLRNRSQLSTARGRLRRSNQRGSEDWRKPSGDENTGLCSKHVTLWHTTSKGL